MPFFQNASACLAGCPHAAKQNTLQVQMPGTPQERWSWLRKGRRVCIFASRRGWGASVSVEAAFSLSIFIFAMVCMMYPFRMMDRQRQVQAALESVNERLCQYAYLEDGGKAFGGGTPGSMLLLRKMNAGRKQAGTGENREEGRK